jgi:hypothetical protein
MVMPYITAEPLKIHAKRLHWSTLYRDRETKNTKRNEFIGVANPALKASNPRVVLFQQPLALHGHSGKDEHGRFDPPP